MKAKIIETNNATKIFIGETELNLDCATKYSIKRSNGKNGIELTITFCPISIETEIKVEEKKKDY